MKRKTSAEKPLPGRADVVILGAGLTGLIAARELLRSGCRDVLLLEREARPGGLLKTNRAAGVTIDELPHVFFTKNERAAGVFRGLAGPVRSFRHNLGVMWKGGWVDFPFQNNVHQLSAEDRLAVLRSLLAARTAEPRAPRNLEEYALRELGGGITDLFFRPYNEKLWQTPLAGMSYAWLASKIKLPGPAGLAASILGMKPPAGGDVAPHAEFIYPKKGGIEGVVENLLREIAPVSPVCSTAAARIDARRRVVHTPRGPVRYGRLISTLPLGAALGLAGLGRAAERRRLRATRVLCLHYALSSVNLPPYHWIYAPDPALPYYRLTRADLFNPGAFPGGKALIVECALPCGSAAAPPGLRARVTASLVRQGVIREKDIKGVWAYDHWPAYPVPHVSHAADTAACLAALSSAGIISAGRFGEWSVYNMDHSIEAGLAAAGKILK
ncbi:MAG: protoporphyrinogen/coproporphyrinogen oxidase [Elusimicrobiales bacterium]